MSGQNDKSGSFLSSMITWNRDIRAMPYVVLGLAALVVGGITAILVFVRGHDAMYTMNQSVPWGLLIATYSFFVLTSSGLAFIGGLGNAFRYEKYSRISKRIVVMAFIILLAGFTQIGMDLGHPLKLGLYMLLSPNFYAPIAWMGVFYTIELLILAIELYLILKPNPSDRDRNYSAIAGFFAMFFGVLAAGALGYVFGANNARPFFHGIYFSTFFVTSGITAGAALLLLVHNMVYKWRIPSELKGSMNSLGKLMGIGIGIMIFLYLWKILSAVYTPSPDGSYPAVKAMLAGPLSWNFWVGEILLAVTLPLLLVAVTRAQNMKILGVASLLFMVGFFFTKYDFIIAGQVPSLRGAFVGYGLHPPTTFTTYGPSAGEWMIFVLGCGVFLTLYFAAEKFLNLKE